MVLGPNLMPQRSFLLSSETPGIHPPFYRAYDAGIIYAIQRALENDPASSHSVLCHPTVSHIATDFKYTGWGCGYVNAQMLLSYLRQASPNEYIKSFGEGIPSVRKIQAFIEAGWSKGWLK